MCKSNNWIVLELQIITMSSIINHIDKYTFVGST